MDSIAERYLRLGLGLGKHVEGLVDGYFGPPELAEDDRQSLEELLEEARSLRAHAASADLDEQRRRWLTAQVDGLECVTEMTAGTEVAWREAVRRCYGIEVERTPEEHFEEAHATLDAALPGSGDLAERLEAWRMTQDVPRDKLLPGFHALVDELRIRTRDIVELPEGERFDAQLVSGQPWGAYNWYLGDLESRIDINTDLPVRSYYLAILAAHEGYPGHHTEAICKEARLVRGEGRDELSILLIHTPECLVAEGIATNAIEQALGEDWTARAAEILRALDIPFDEEIARVVVSATGQLQEVDVNIALAVAEDGWSESAAVEYHRRWALSPEDRARRAVAFDTHPMWSIYVPTYSYGEPLVRAFSGSRDAGFRSLLTEQLTTADLLDAFALRADGDN
ncbi:MAG TPA: hypothetical protein VFP31_03865 [Gaiellaceae bacterium]|nr:hypothetical protein [Gaiellaceae bacterium]